MIKTTTCLDNCNTYEKTFCTCRASSQDWVAVTITHATSSTTEKLGAANTPEEYLTVDPLSW